MNFNFEPDKKEICKDGLIKLWKDGSVLVIIPRDGVRRWTREGLAWLWCTAKETISVYYRQGLLCRSFKQYTVTTETEAELFHNETSIKKTCLLGMEKKKAAAKRAANAYAK